MSPGSCRSWVVHHRALDFERALRHGLFVLVFAWLTILTANLLGAGLKNVAFTVGDPQSSAYGWTTNGNVAIGGGQAVLTEDGVHLPVQMSQQFVLSSNVTRIHITLQALNLATNAAGQQPDAFQISLVDSATNSLVPLTGQSQTTAFFNYQQDGKVYYGSATTVPSATGSGNVWQPQFPVTIVLDVAAFTTDQPATLSFDLLGFDQIASSVVMTQVRLEGIEPVAAADAAPTLEDTAVAVLVLTNDIVNAGVPLDPVSVQISGGPAHGVATVNPATGAINYQPATNYSGADSFSYTVADSDGNRSAAAAVSITVTAVNDTPTLNAIGNVNLLEDAVLQTVSLTSISAGGGETQVLTVTASSSAPGVIPHPTVDYTGPAATGTLAFTPVANATGTATITVVVKDDGGTANGGVDAVTNTFTVTVTAMNDAPTLAAVGNVDLLEDAGQQTVNLTGISAGGGESQTLTVTATSSAPGLIPHPTVNYDSPASAGSLSFTPADNASGSATITVVVRDNGGTDGGGVDAITNSFTVTVTAVNDAPTLGVIGNVMISEDAGLQTVNLTGLSAGGGESQSLTVTASSSAPSIIPHPAVNHTSPDTAGTLTFAPVANASGVATITVVVRDNGGTANGGVDAVTNTFTVTVTPVNDAPTLDPVAAQLLAPGQSLSLTLQAADMETPAGSLQFSLLSGPSGMTVSAAGSLQWTAPATSVAVTNDVAVKVSDDGAPSLSATQTISVIMIPKPLLQISRSGSAVTVQWPAVPGLRYQLQYATDIAAPTWTDLGGETSATGTTMSYQDSDVSVPAKKFYRLRVQL